MNFADLSAGLTIDITNFTKGLNDASRGFNDWASYINKNFGNVFDRPIKEAKTGFKDVSRIVQGILISQAFYRGLSAIQDVTAAVFEFNSALEYSNALYGQLFQDTDLGTNFTNVLQDLAVATQTEFTAVEAASRQLLAYGVNYQNVLYVLQGVLKASNAQGSTQSLNQISRALGQIYTKGKLASEEIRQLANAGIPIYEILGEKLGLTRDQLADIGNLAIPAGTAINAIIDGLNERFDGIYEATEATIKGLRATIKEGFTQIAAEAFNPLYEGIRRVLINIRNMVVELRNILSTSGIGGVFEHIVPPQFQELIRTLLANVLNLTMAIWNLVKAIAQFLNPVLVGLARTFNIFAPILTIILNTFTRLLNIIYSNAQLMQILTNLVTIASVAFVVLRIRALTWVAIRAVVVGVTRALQGLGAVLTFLTAHPFWSLLIILIGTVGVLTGLVGKLADAFRNFFKGLTATQGYDPDDLLLPSQEERTSELEKFNEQLGNTADAMDELADNTGKAAKAARQLLSFDEVFSLSSPDETGNLETGIVITDWDYTVPDFPELNQIVVPELELPGSAELDAWSWDFVNQLLDALGGKEKVLSAGLGALLGAVIGGLIGGVPGAIIGAALGLFAGYFWDEIAKALQLNDYQKIAIPIGAGIGAAIGFLIGGPAGAAIGTAVGALVGYVVGLIIKGFRDGFDQGDLTKLGTSIGTLVGAGIGFAIGGPGGAIIGAAIGGLVGFVGGKIIDGFKYGFTNTDRTQIGLAVGTLVGAGIGFAIAGPGGAIIGAAVGALVGWIVSDIANRIAAVDKNDFSTKFGYWMAVGIRAVTNNPIVVAAIDALAKGTVGELGQKLWNQGVGIVKALAFINIKVIEFVDEFWDNFYGAFDAVALTVLNILSKLEEFRNAFIELLAEIAAPWFKTWAEMMIFQESILADIWTGIQTFIGDVTEGWTTFWTDVSSLWIYWQETLEELAGRWLGRLVAKAVEFWDNLTQRLTAFFAGNREKTDEHFTEQENETAAFLGRLIAKFIEWSLESLRSILNFFNDVTAEILRFFGVSEEDVQKFHKNVQGFINSFVDGAKNAIINFLNFITGRQKTTNNNLESEQKGFFSRFMSALNGFVNSGLSKFRELFTGWWESAKAGLGNLYNAFIGFINNLYTNFFSKLFGFIDRAISKFREFFGLADKANSGAYNNVGANAAPASSRAAAFSIGQNFEGLAGHARGGIFNQEHIASFAEGNKAEAIIPLENKRYMQPFADTIADALTKRLSGTNGSTGGIDEDMRGATYNITASMVIADDRSLTQLERKLHKIRIMEKSRGVRD